MEKYKIEVPDGRKITIQADNPQQALQDAEAWAAENPKQDGGYQDSAFSTGAYGLIQGMTGNFADEFADAALAPVTAGINWAQGEGFDIGKAYEENRDFTRNRVDQMKRDHGGALTAGNIIGSLTIGGGLAKAGLSPTVNAVGAPLKTRIAKGIGEGLAYGSVYGAGGADDGNRIGGALSGGAMGAVAGGAVPAIGDGLMKVGAPIVRNVGNAFKPNTAKARQAVKLVTDRADEAGLTVDDLIKGVEDGRVVGQQDDILMDLTRTIKDKSPGASRKIIDDTLNEGYAANNEAAQAEVLKGLGAADNFFEWRHNFGLQKQADAGPMYKEAFKQNWGPDGPPFALDDLIQSGRIPASTFRVAESVAKIEGRPFGQNLVASIDDATDTVTFSRLPSLEEAEIIRRGIKGAASEAYTRRAATAGPLQRLELEMRGILDNSSPALKNVRQIYSNYSDIQDAAEVGRRMLNMEADEIEFVISRASEPEKQAMRMGFASKVKHKVEKGEINRDAIRNVFGTKSIRRALSTLWPDPDDFAAFQRSMEKGSEFSKLRARTQSGSPTHRYQSDDRAMDPGGIINAGINLATGNAIGAGADAARAIASKMSKQISRTPPEVLERAARILTETNPRQVELLLKRMNAGDRASGDYLEQALRQLLSSPALRQSAVVGSAATQGQ